jgi:hypothetical protein
MIRKDLDHLEALAKAATPGPWHIDERWSLHDVRHPSPGRIPGTGSVCEPHRASDAAYIASASPDVVLGLIADLREARTNEDALRRQLASRTEALQTANGTVASTRPRLALLEADKVSLKNDLARARAERDAALAEVARLREVVEARPEISRKDAECVVWVDPWRAHAGRVR